MSSNIFDQMLEGRKKQCIWIIRYGTTKYPIMEEFDTDLDPNEGAEHAKCIAQRIFEDPDDAPTVIYTSPFVRCAHTAQLIALATPPNHQRHGATTAAKTSNTAAPAPTTTTITTIMPAVRVEPGLTEWMTPDLLLLKTMQEHNHHLPRSAEELAETYGTIDLSHESLINPFVRSNSEDEETLRLSPPEKEFSSTTNSGHVHHFETEQDFLKRCAATMSKLLELHAAEGTNMAIVSHAPCNQALTLYLLQQQQQQQQQQQNDIDHDDTTVESKLASPIVLQPWPLGGITKFTRIIPENDTPSSETAIRHPWTMEFYADTEHLPGKYKKGFKGWSLPCFQHHHPKVQVQQQGNELLVESGITSQPSPTSSCNHSLKATSSIL